MSSWIRPTAVSPGVGVGQSSFFRQILSPLGGRYPLLLVSYQTEAEPTSFEMGLTLCTVSTQGSNLAIQAPVVVGLWLHVCSLFRSPFLSCFRLSPFSTLVSPLLSCFRWLVNMRPEEVGESSIPEMTGFACYFSSFGLSVCRLSET